MRGDPVDLTDLSAWPTYPEGDYADLVFPLLPMRTDDVTRKYADLYPRLDVEEYRRRYLKTGNPIYAWRAYARCRGAKLGIPDWVLKYFDEPARAFWRWSMVGRPPKEKLGEALADALLMSRPGRQGPGTIFAEVFPHKESLALAIATNARLREMRAGGAGAIPKLYRAIAEVADKSGVSTATVRRAWDRHKEQTQE